MECSTTKLQNYLRQPLRAMPVCLFCVAVLFSTSLLAQSAPAPRTSQPACDLRATLQSVDHAIKVGNNAEARLLLGRLLKCPSLIPAEQFTIGRFYGRTHDYKTALDIFARLDPTIPNLQTHAYAVALSQFELADYRAAVATLKTLQASTGLNTDCTNLLAVSYSKLGQYQDAYTLLLKQLQDNPKDLYAYLNLITLMADAGRLADALTVANQAVEAFPQDAEVLVVRGAAYTLLSQLDKARSDFAQAVTLAPEKVRPHFLLAVTDYTLGSYSVASDELKAAIASGLADADLEYLLAECTIKLDPAGTDQAIADLNRALALNDASVPALTLRGKLLLGKADPRAAAADLEKAHHMDPTMRSATYNLARAYSALGRQKEAATLYSLLNKQSTDTVTEMSSRNMKQALSGAPAK